MPPRGDGSAPSLTLWAALGYARSDSDKRTMNGLTSLDQSYMKTVAAGFLFFYHGRNELQAVRSGRWKLVFPHTYTTLTGRPGGHNGVPAKYDRVKLASAELYDLRRDPEEKRNVAARHPTIVSRLEILAEQCRADPGDSLTGRIGAGARQPGRIADN